MNLVNVRQALKQTFYQETQEKIFIKQFSNIVFAAKLQDGKWIWYSLFSGINGWGVWQTKIFDDVPINPACIYAFEQNYKDTGMPSDPVYAPTYASIY